MICPLCHQDIALDAGRYVEHTAKAKVWPKQPYRCVNSGARYEAPSDEDGRDVFARIGRNNPPLPGGGLR